MCEERKRKEYTMISMCQREKSRTKGEGETLVRGREGGGEGRI